MPELDPNAARTVVVALSSGSVPLEYAYHYNVGREEQMDAVQKEILNGTKRLRFINGDYGSGKTQFLATIRHWCTANNFVPSHVVLSPRGTPLYDLSSVYSRIVKNLFLSNDCTSPIESVLEYIYSIFTEWLKTYNSSHMPRCQKYLIDPLGCHHCNVNGNVEEMYIKGFRSLDPSLQQAIILYREARWGFNPDFATADLVIRWLEGQSLYRKELNYLGLWENLGSGDILKGLNEIAKLVSLTNKKGFVIMLDEAEGIEKCMPYQRPTAYGNLERLINDVNAIKNLYFLYATTPAFFADVNSYSQVFAGIVKAALQTNLQPLTMLQMRELLNKISRIYFLALENTLSESKKEVLERKLHEYCENCSIAQSFSVRDNITNAISAFQRLIGEL